MPKSENVKFASPYLSPVASLLPLEGALSMFHHFPEVRFQYNREHYHELCRRFQNVVTYNHFEMGQHPNPDGGAAQMSFWSGLRKVGRAVGRGVTGVVRYLSGTGEPISRAIT